ncbi:MAG: hypothetical protein ACI83D_000779 [Planctomycetota bacterium]|jgi:hypothetical protein
MTSNQFSKITPPLKKIILTGGLAAGKTTMARKLHEITQIPTYPLDSVFWEKEGGLKQDIFMEKVQKILDKDQWIMDGSFPNSVTFVPRLEAADIIIYFNLPKYHMLWRLIKRLFKYGNTRRPDITGDKTEASAFWHCTKYMLGFNAQPSLEKVLEYTSIKNVIIIRNHADEKKLIKTFRDLAPESS